jgi:hypothetical protein
MSRSAPADNEIYTSTTGAIGRLNEKPLWTVSIVPVLFSEAAYLGAG